MTDSAGAPSGAPVAASQPGVEALIDAYCLAWHHPDPAKRRSLIEAALEPDCLYEDPTARVEGSEALLTHIGALLAKRPGFALERLGRADAHHDMLRFGWRMRLADGRTGPDCVDFCRLSMNGKLALVVGFFGPLPSDHDRSAG